MRITGGKYLNRTVKCPKGIIRPAMERMRESMFSILGDITDFSFLDLFTGSGCIGLEALSRGAKPVDIVEKDYKKKITITENLSMAEESIKLYLMDVRKYIRICREQYDIIHLDPPFDFPQKQKLIELILENDILKNDGLLMMHYPSEDNIPEQFGRLKKKDLRKYGRSELIFYHFAK